MYLVFKSPLRKFSFEAVALFSFLPALIYLYLFALCLLHPAYACYVYPPDMKDPCEQKQCSYGAQCVPSLDGFSHRCQCPTRCNTYGDNIGSTPVCGNDGIDYDNMCEMRKAACQQMTDIRVKYYGKCGKYTFNLPFYCLVICLWPGWTDGKCSALELEKNKCNRHVKSPGEWSTSAFCCFRLLVGNVSLLLA